MINIDFSVLKICSQAHNWFALAEMLEVVKVLVYQSECVAKKFLISFHPKHHPTSISIHNIGNVLSNWNLIIKNVSRTLQPSITNITNRPGSHVLTLWSSCLRKKRRAKNLNIEKSRNKFALHSRTTRRNLNAIAQWMNEREYFSDAEIVISVIDILHADATPRTQLKLIIIFESPPIMDMPCTIRFSLSFSWMLTTLSDT